MENKFVFDTNIYNINDIDFKPNSRFIILSKSNSGKSVLVKCILYNLITKHPNFYRNLFILGDTVEYNDSDYNFIDKKNRKPFTDENLLKIYNYHEKKEKQGDIQHSILVCDDICTNSKLMEKLYMQGRHIGLCVILSYQDCTGALNPKVRSNSNYIFLKELSNERLDKIINSMIVIGGVPKNEIFQYITNNNHKYQFIMFDNNSNIDKDKRLKIIETKLLDLQIINNKTNKNNKK